MHCELVSTKNLEESFSKNHVFDSPDFKYGLFLFILIDNDGKLY